MSELTPDQVAALYASSMQSVELLKRGEPVVFEGDWSTVEEANKKHLDLVLTYDCWTSEDLTPLRDAAVAETPRNVQATTAAFNPLTQKAVEGIPIKQGNQWMQTWVVVDLTPQEQQYQAQIMQKSIVEAVQQRLDNFARTRNYDGILSACTYATSAVPQFAAEGQYCVSARDATWTVLYQILADVQSGTRTAPSGFADIEPDLPVLEWP